MTLVTIMTATSTGPVEATATTIMTTTTDPVITTVTVTRTPAMPASGA